MFHRIRISTKFVKSSVNT